MLSVDPIGPTTTSAWIEPHDIYPSVQISHCFANRRVRRTKLVIGATGKLKASAVSRPIHFRDVLATIYHNLGIDPHGDIRDKANRPVNILPPTSEVICELT